MAKKVKNTTRVSSKHQVTIPAVAFHAAGLKPGDTVLARPVGAGQVLFTRIDELIDQYCGAIDSGGALRRQIEDLTEEWR